MENWQPFNPIGKQGTSPEWSQDTNCDLRECSFSYPRRPEGQRDHQRLFTHDEAALRAARCIADVVGSATPRPEYGQEPHVLIVGGFVRDAVLGVSSKDLDIEVFGLSDYELEVRLNRAFPGRVVRAGRAYSGLLVRFESDLVVDVTVPRSAENTAVTDPSIKFSQAALRRDFTMNALGANPYTGEIYDPCGGIEDLMSGKLRHVNAASFVSDPIRVYRAAQFCARFDLQLGGPSLDLLRGMVSSGALDDLPRPRVTEELDKLLLRADRPALGLAVLSQVGLLERDWPELPFGPEDGRGGWSQQLLRMNYAVELREGLVKDEVRELMLASLLMSCGYSLSGGPDQAGLFHVSNLRFYFLSTTI